MVQAVQRPRRPRGPHAYSPRYLHLPWSDDVTEEQKQKWFEEYIWITVGRLEKEKEIDSNVDANKVSSISRSALKRKNKEVQENTDFFINKLNEKVICAANDGCFVAKTYIYKNDYNALDTDRVYESFKTRGFDFVLNCAGVGYVIEISWPKPLDNL